MSLRAFFSENDDFVREKNTLKVKETPRKVTILQQIQGNHVGKRR
jgi:hypothetical protein